MLIHREVQDSGMATSVFALPTECMEQLEHFIAADSGVTVNHELRLRLDRVAASMASGGGAHGGAGPRY